MPSSLQDDLLKRRVRFPLRWALLCVAAMFTCRFLGYKQLEQASVIGSFILITLYIVTSDYIVLRRKHVETPEETEETEETEPEEFYIHFPEPDEYGWCNYTIIPSKNAYKEDLCFGGPPVDISTFEYSVKDERVFSRLMDLLEKNFNADYYEVVNGQVLEADIRSRNSSPTTDQHIERLKKEVNWSEVKGSLRYFILSKHGCSLHFLFQEKERLTKGFDALAEKATALGAVRPVGGLLGGYYRAKDDASEQSKAAIDELQKAESLERLGLSFTELRDYEHIIQTLDGLLAEGSAAVSA